MAPNKLKRVEEFMNSNLHTDLSLLDMANAAGMSLYHFAKSFEDTTGQSPRKYVKVQRLHHARTLLHDAGLPISEIARTVDFSTATPRRSSDSTLE